MPPEEKNTATVNITENEYSVFGAFAKEHSFLTYESFDSHTMKDLSLFAMREDFDFSSLEEILDRIIHELPAIKRIFSTPIIRLKDSSEILPVESVRIVNNRTIVHASSHSELWENISGSSIRPRKLMTLQHEDNYSIYENLVFVNMIDMILRFVNANIAVLTEILYSNREMKFDLLERVNHISHYLATAKLHTAYIREYDKYREVAERCLDKLLFVKRIIESRLGCPLYKKCKNKHRNLALKKTNIFRMHKDYHRVYLLMKYFSDMKLEPFEGESGAFAENDENYNAFCSMMLAFSLGHFNFELQNGQTLDFLDLCVKASFKSWTLLIQKTDFNGKDAFVLTFCKDIEYRILLSPCRDLFEKEKNKFDEAYLISSFDPENESVVISLYDIESFRRIQRILLRGMVMSDTLRDVCPFCGKALERSETQGGELFECASCRTQIFELICPEKREKYIETAIKHYSASKELKEKYSSFDGLNKKITERLMHYRNVTEIDSDGELICPICKMKHFRKH